MSVPLPDTAHEERRLLEDGGIYLLVAEQRRHLVHLLGHVAPVGTVSREDILCAAGSLIHALRLRSCNSIGGL